MVERILSTAGSGMALARQHLAESASRIASPIPPGVGPAETHATLTPVKAEAAPGSSQPIPSNGAPVALLGHGLDLVAETVTQVQAINAFKTNVAVFRTADELHETTMSLVA